MNRACLTKKINLHEQNQHASSILPIKINFVRMKRLFAIIVAVLFTATIWSQSPQKMSYQAVIRNSSNVLVTSSAVGMKISILQGSATGTPVYVETQTPTTNANGLVSIEIGGGTIVSGTFAAIDWSAGTYFIKTETDPTGGTSYTISGTSQLLSVPYALLAKKAASYSETDPVFTAWDRSNGISIANTQISNWSGATSAFLTGITSGQVTTALGFTPYNSTNPSGYSANTGTVTSVAMSTPVGLTLAGTPITTSGTLALTLTSGYAIPTSDQLFPGFGTTADKAANGNHSHDYSGIYAALVHDHGGIFEPVITTGTASQYLRGDKSWQTLNTGAVTEGANLYYTDARAKAAISLTTTGNSGAATYTSGVINIPDYTLSGLGGQSTLNGSGLVRMTGTSVSYDNSTYLTSFTETDPNAVLLTGNQTITGNKTFTGTITVPAPVNANDATNQAYVDKLGEDMKKVALSSGDLVSDFDGNTYKTVKIGSQTWLMENLKTTHFLNGDLIPTTSPVNLNITAEISPIYEWPVNGNETDVDDYGRLYTWYTVSDPRGICPSGWHVSSNAEWEEMVAFLGGAGVAGAKLKEAGEVHWESGNVATNSSGFTALPGGFRAENGTFYWLHNSGYFWTTPEADASTAYRPAMLSDWENIDMGSASGKSAGFSVRCIKNNEVDKTYDGTVKLSGINMATGAGNGKVMTSDNTGNGSWQSQIGMVPVGGLVAWLKDLLGTPSLPSNYAECNGQTISDSESPFNGQAIPNLNASLFLIGQTSSGNTGGQLTHSHTVTLSPPTAQTIVSTLSLNQPVASAGHSHTGSALTTANLPPYYSVVWIIRIK
jgi:uncharacterized protein (TIGR02145 family)